MTDTVSPVSFRVNVARLPQRGMPVVIDASEEQRNALAAEHGLEAVQRFRADLAVTLWKRNGVRVVGSVKAKIVQTCVVTLDPLESEVDEEIDSVFLPEDSKLGREGFGHGGEIILDAEGDDSPETFAGEWIDVGALAEEFFGLGIDPYPRKPGLESEETAPAEEADTPDEGSLAGKLKAALARKTD